VRQVTVGDASIALMLTDRTCVSDPVNWMADFDWFDSDLQLLIRRATCSTLLATKTHFLGFAIEVKQSLIDWTFHLIYGHNCPNQWPLTKESEEDFEGRHVTVGSTSEQRYLDKIGRCQARETMQKVNESHAWRQKKTNKTIGQSMENVAIFDKIQSMTSLRSQDALYRPHLYGCIRRNQGGTSRKQAQGN
jgi:hypothetical protein